MGDCLGFGRFARTAVLSLAGLASCATQQPLPEAKLLGSYETPGPGRGVYLFTFKDRDANGLYDLLEIRFKPDEDPVVVLVGEDDVKKLYSKMARTVVAILL